MNNEKHYASETTCVTYGGLRRISSRSSSTSSAATPPLLLLLLLLLYAASLLDCPPAAAAPGRGDDFLAGVKHKCLDSAGGTSSCGVNKGELAAADVGGSLEACGGGAGEVGGDDARGLEGKDKTLRRATEEGKGGGGGLV